MREVSLTLLILTSFSCTSIKQPYRAPSSIEKNDHSICSLNLLALLKEPMIDLSLELFFRTYPNSERLFIAHPNKSIFLRRVEPESEVPNSDFFKTALSPEEYKSIQSYKGGTCGVINASLRENRRCKISKESIFLLDSALEKIPPHRGVVYRGAEITDFKVRTELLRGEGNIISDKGFLSTSRRHERAFNHSDPGSEHIYMVINSKSGRSVENLVTRFIGDEKEVIFPRNTKFRVEIIEERSDGSHVLYLNEL